jgi:large subunit ribosomal protein L10
VVVDYVGLTVGQFTELRKRLTPSGSQLHVVKNSIFRIAVKEAGLADLTGALAGQMAVVTGKKDVTAAAKILKSYQAEFEKPKVKFGYLGNKRLEAEDLKTLADLPSLEVLRAKLVGLINTPATRVVQIINTPGSQLARVLKAKSEQAKPEQAPA